MRRLARAVARFLFIRLGYRRVYRLGLIKGYGEGWDDGFQDAAANVQDWYVCPEDDAYIN